jgi:hypothetical protein
METGQIITTQGQPSGRASSTSWRYDQAVRRAPQSAAQQLEEKRGALNPI